MITRNKNRTRRKRRATPALQAAADGWNSQTIAHVQRAQGRAAARKRRTMAEELTAIRRARYYARKET